MLKANKIGRLKGKNRFCKRNYLINSQQNKIAEMLEIDISEVENIIKELAK